MVAADFLQDQRVREWLNGVEPAWTLLSFESLLALRQEPSTTNTAIRIASDVVGADASPVVQNATLLLRTALERGGLPLTKAGNLTRSFVADMRELISWPGYDPAEAFRLHKVINEPDFLPLHILRFLTQAARMLHLRRDKLTVTALGKSMLQAGKSGDLLAILFHIAFWRIDLEYFGRGLLGSWPQDDVGIVLWSLSAAATGWQSSEKLARLCAIPEPAMLSEASWDRASYAIESRILRPILWFGLLEHRSVPITDSVLSSQHFYRKTPLFDRLLTFRIVTDLHEVARH
jgi:hypothetical protein